MGVSQNIQLIQEKINQAALSADRAPEEITLIAVTKTISPPEINKAFKSGIQHFGENRVQELLEKYDKIDENLKWHLIGSLQTNKVKYIIDRVELIHSLDRISLAQEIEKRAAQIDKQVSVLLQVNISKENTKSGIYEEQIPDFIRAMENFPHVRIRGLMTIGPLTRDANMVRECFRRMKGLFDQLKAQNIPYVDMECLSMGMTNDFDIAIEEGANMVRIGRAIFGERTV